MNPEDIQQRKSEIIEKFGDWTNHNICLQGELHTISKETISGAEVKLRRIVQMVADISGQPFEHLRVLDLACLEGLYGLELALQGANVVGIEGRQANLEKAKFTKEVLGLENIDFFQDDVRNLSAKKYGTFDVVLCLGIFYHLDAPDIFEFMEKMAAVCNKILIIDTHVSFTAESSTEYKGKQYWGRIHPEHEPSSTPEQRINSLWSSLDNVNSFWLTRPSFYNLLSSVGFTSVYECHHPPVQKYEMMRWQNQADRSTFLGVKGQRLNFRSSAVINELPVEDSQENY